MHYLDYGAAGDGDVTLAVGEEGGADQVRMEGEFREFAIRRDPHPTPHLRGEGLRAEFTSRETGLLRPPADVEAQLEMPEVRADDLSFYNHYLPEGVVTGEVEYQPPP